MIKLAKYPDDLMFMYALANQQAIRSSPNALYWLLISDTHFGHGNIKHYCERPDDWEDRIWVEWNLIPNIYYNDTIILHLGDLLLPKSEAKNTYKQRIRTLPGIRFLIKGNHDKMSDKEYAEMGFIVIPPFYMNLGNRYIVFNHYPIDLKQTNVPDPSSAILIHGHVHNNMPLDQASPEYAGFYDFKRYKNISLEVMDYKLWSLENVLKSMLFWTKVQNNKGDK